MPLTPPPCIDIFVDCHDTDIGGGNGSSNSSGNTRSNNNNGVNIGGNVDVNLGGTLDTSGLRNGVQNGLDALGNSAANAGNTLAAKINSGAQRLAAYTISAVNRGKDAVKGFVFSHGPLPFGATFDPTRSSSTCMQVGQEVQCTIDLLPGEQKNVEIAYKVNNSVSCAIARVLQKVKNLTGVGTNTVSTSVSCTMKTVSDSEGLITNTSSSLGTITNATGSSLGGAYGQNGASNTAIENAIGLTTTAGYGIGYKPVSMPRTGAADVLFSTRKSDYVLTAVSHTEGTSLVSEGIVTVVLIVSIGAAFMRRLYLRYA